MTDNHTEPTDPPDGTPAVPAWADPMTGTTAAILIDTSGVSVVGIGKSESLADVLIRVVGDPFVNRVAHLYGVDCWVGDNSLAASPHNRIATQIMHQLIRDVHEGRYVATDHDRVHAHYLLAKIEEVLDFHGPFLITGASHSDSVVPLDENFRRWFTAGTGDITAIRHSLRTIVATECGIPAADVVVTATR